MRVRHVFLMSALAGAAFLPDLAAPARGAEGARQRAVVMFQDPVSVGGTFVMGRVMIVHDEDRKDRGEPCTQLYQVAEGKQPVELLAVHCKRVVRPVADQLRLAMRTSDPSYRILTSYQFAGADHAHELLPAGHSAH